MKDGKLMYTGHLGDMVSEEDGKKAAELALINALAAVKGAAGSLDNIKRIVKMNVFVQSAAGFGNQPEVANGASELLEKIFGEKGKHARAAVGVSMLPRNAAVELELIVQL
jgi:enamine deaminase RidA (YjgF/YER057c/UK114 family)